MLKSTVLVFILLVVVLSSLPAQPESPISKKYVSILAHDFTRITLAPAHWHNKDWLRFGVVSSAVGRRGDRHEHWLLVTQLNRLTPR